MVIIEIDASDQEKIKAEIREAETELRSSRKKSLIRHL